MARYALVIGISEYLSPSLSPLSKTINDAEAVARLLEQYGDFQSVQRLPQRWNKEKSGYEIGSAKVTGGQLGQELRQFLLEKAKQSEAFIYFSGHGFTISDNLGQQKGYLATSDCQIEAAGSQIVEQKYAIPLDSLNELIRDSQLSSLVMLLDCCHSGYFLERQLIERTLTSFTSPRDYYLIAACRGFERAGVIKSQEYSIFTGAVVKGLAPENAGSSRSISSDRLFDFISNELKGSVQEPIRMGWGRAISLVTYPATEILTPEDNTFNKENPYRGLYAFEAEQADYFKGRDQAVRVLMSRLAESRFLAVIGYSGSGKSSLVKAGLLPQLKSDRIPASSQWDIVSFTPGEHPLGKLTDALNRQLQDKPQLLFIDQFEEIFTLCQNEEQRKSFIRLVVQEVNTTERQTRIIITIRGDFLNRCADYLEIANLINSIPPTSFIVTPMSPTELEEAIEKPAQLHGVAFELGLVSQIATDVINRPGALPILQYALKELWRVCIEETESPAAILTHRGYAEIGGVKGALDKRATIIYQSLSEVDQEFARRLFMELVQLSDTGEVTRRRADWERLRAIADSLQQSQRVVELLAGSQQRLIITDENTVEVAHEALLTEWKLLNNWIEENRENIRISRSLEEDCREWDERFNQSDDALLTGAKLAVISEWVNKNQPRLTPLETEFFQKSLYKRDSEIQAQLEQVRKLQQVAEARAKAEAEKVKQERQKTLAAIIAGIFVTSTLGFWLLAQHNYGRIKQQEAYIASKYLTDIAQQNLEQGYQIDALVTSIKALDLLKKIPGSHTDQLIQLQSIIYKIHEQNRLEEQDKVWGVSFSPNGQIASASSDGKIKLWNTQGQILDTINSGHKGVYGSIRFSHNGKLLVSGSQDKIVKLWRIEDTKIKFIKEFIGHQDAVSDVAFSLDNQIIASSGFDGRIMIWRVNTRQNQPVKSLLNNTIYSYVINSLDFYPGNQSLIYYSGNDSNVRFIDWKNNIYGTIQQNTPTGYHGESVDVLIVRFSKKNNILASGDHTGLIKLWDIKNGKFNCIGIIKADNNKIFALDFSSDGKYLASAGTEEIVKVWEVDKAIKLFTENKTTLEHPFVEPLKGHNAIINRLEFSHNLKLIASASDDKTIRLWRWNLDAKIDSQPEWESLWKYSCTFIQDYLNIHKHSSQSLQGITKLCANYNNS